MILCTIGPRQVLHESEDRHDRYMVIYTDTLLGQRLLTAWFHLAFTQSKQPYHVMQAIYIL